MIRHPALERLRVSEPPRPRSRVSRLLLSLRPRVLAALLVAVASAGCGRGEPASDGRASATAVHAGKAPRLPDQLGLGHAPSRAQLAALDIDANPAGVGLPPGEGTYAEGATIYAQQCALCHGARGEGQGTYPRLIGAEPRQSFPFGNDPKLPKTVGNYWPYATTVYDYIHRAMPYNAPGSLAPREVYSLVAYLLAENQVIPRNAVMNAATLPRVKMPAHGHFVPDDRTGGPTFR